MGVEETFDQTGHPFIIKFLKKLSLEGTYLKIIKATYDNLQPIPYSVMKS